MNADRVTDEAIRAATLARRAEIRRSPLATEAELQRAALSAADAVRDGLATKAAQPPAPEPQGAVDENPAPTHRCKKCGALWRYWPVFDTGDDEDVWSLRSKECGECCDGPMTREQIKPMTLGGMAEHLAIAALQQPHGTNSGARVTDEAVKAAWQTFNRHEDGFAPTAMRAAISAALPHLTAEQAETVAGGAVDDHLWCLHIIGPDDVHPAPSKEQAERAATWVNARFSEVKDVLIKAEVIEWPHSPESHARGVAEFSKLWAIPNESKETTEGFVNILETIAFDFFSDDVLGQFKPERAAIRAAIAALRQQQPALDRFPEINPSNYGEQEVDALNAWGIEIVLAAAHSPQEAK